MRRFALLAVVVLATASAQAQTPLVHYRAENNYADSSGNGRTATVNGSVGFRASGTGFGQGFDVQNPINSGNAANYLSTPGLSGANAAALDGTGLTVAAFFREDTFANNGSIVNLRNAGNASGFTLEPAFNNPGSLLFLVQTPSGNKQITVPGFTVGEAFHVAAVFDPANQLLSVYRNGQLVQSAPTSDSQPLQIDESESFQIGRNVANLNGFDGLIDEVRVYNRPLTADEVAVLVPEPTTVAMLGAAASLLLVRRRRR